MSDFPSPSEQDFRRRVRDLEAGTYAQAMALRRMLAHAEALHSENARLRRALRTLARLQSPRVSRAVMEVLNDA